MAIQNTSKRTSATSRAFHFKEGRDRISKTRYKKRYNFFTVQRMTKGIEWKLAKRLIGLSHDSSLWFIMEKFLPQKHGGQTEGGGGVLMCVCLVHKTIIEVAKFVPGVCKNNKVVAEGSGNIDKCLEATPPPRPAVHPLLSITTVTVCPILYSIERCLGEFILWMNTLQNIYLNHTEK